MPQNPAIEPSALAAEFTRAGQRAGFQCEELAHLKSGPSLALTRDPDPTRPCIYLSGGVHGDEPAGTLALLHLLREKRLPEDFAFHICPLVNPDGLAANTRENADGIDLNRDYYTASTREVAAHRAWFARHRRAYCVSLCLHEDYEGRGFYLYEVGHSGQPRFADRIVEACRPLCGIDDSPEIDGREAVNGVISPDLSTIPPEMETTWPEAFYLLRNHSRHNATFETPSDQAIDQRIACHVRAVETAIAFYRWLPRRTWSFEPASRYWG